MTPNPHAPVSVTRAHRALLALCAATVLLAACGGSDTPAEPGAAAEASGHDDTPTRRFTLWAGGQEATVRAEQAALAQLDGEPAADEVRLVVRLNPAALPPFDRAALAGSGTGEAGDASAQRARLLAAKAAAVASAVDGLMANSVLARAPGAAVRRQYAHALEGFVVTVPFAQAQAVADALARDAAVDAVELDRPLSVGQSSPVRTLDGRAWGVDRIDQRARSFDGAFRNTRNGQGVTVHVVDTGVSPHEQFGTRLRAGYSAVADAQGTRDCHGHGTHVAGTAAGSTLGVASGAAIVPVRVLGCNGSGSGSQLLAGLDWIAANGTRPGVVNMSLGGSAFDALDAAAQRLVATGFTVVAAAGNSAVDACTQSPARAAGLVTIGASDNADARASFSNTGTCVALWAPGTAIASAGIASSTAVVSMNGTSMAAPHAAGAAALLLQAQPAATAAQVRTRLLQDATPNLVLGLSGSTTRALLYAGDSNASPLPAPVAVRPAAVAMATTVPTPGRWVANATVRVLNAQGAAVAGARVAGRFSNTTAELTCTTAGDGRCTLASAVAVWGTTKTLSFSISGITGSQLSDSGQGVRSAQMAQPAAPVARVAALTGVMQRSSATAAAWTPQFTVALADTGNAPVTGAVVQAQLRVHSGGRVVGVQNLACLTAANGQCRLAWSGPALGSSHTGAVLQLVSVARPFLTLQSGGATQASVGVVR